MDDLDGIPGLDLYRAMAAHQAAHLHYTTAALSAEHLSQAQMVFIGLIEDARIEYLAARDFPGLAKLWGRLLARDHDAPPEHPTVLALEKFARRLNDPGLSTNDPDLDTLANTFHSEIESNMAENAFSWQLGLELFHIFAARRDVPSLRILQSLRIPYRDDNRFIWDHAEFDWTASGHGPAPQRQTRKYVSVMEMATRSIPNSPGTMHRKSGSAKMNSAL